MSKQKFFGISGIKYSSAEEATFYDLLCTGKTTDALIFAARHYKRIGTYALDRAVEQYEQMLSRRPAAIAKATGGES